MNALWKKLCLTLATIILATPALAADFKINRYVALTWNTNSYWLESDSGIVIIDAQLFRSDAKLMAVMIKSTGKPVAGAFITHAHADHFGGLNALFEELGPFPVITTEKTAAGMKPTHARFLTYGYGSNFDAKFVPADTIVEDGAEMELAGIKFVVDDIGPGESENSIVIHQPDRNILFTGDATMHGSHFYLGDGYSNGALEQHRYLAEAYGDATWFYPGHGDPAKPKAILAPEVAYITYQRTLVQEALQDEANRTADGGLRQGAVQTITKAVLERYPYLGEYGLGEQTLLRWNINGIVSEMKAVK